MRNVVVLWGDFIDAVRANDIGLVLATRIAIEDHITEQAQADERKRSAEILANGEPWVNRGDLMSCYWCDALRLDEPSHADDCLWTLAVALREQE